ncbi:iron complex transport system substrate-binding protein [Paenibacillus algorifonticola]|uniref:Iron complex transport system substrate-binding protein n=1 Tax=Paenibacillus algorifonticola TaxID=684063 RepID=A0A1I2DNV1_9BACL|nr:iron-hydroxamate ABC transporter substrate-binding protein [Paenibacillus algorifonticola]SFE82302.1 iron complex transport system substrate-binding protein [Paenibacillus algorifonticola]
MKKLFLPSLLILMLVISACGNGAASNGNSGNSSNAAASTAPSESPAASDAAASTEPAATGTITYQSEQGPVEVPANPQRVIVLSSYAGNVMALGVNLVGVDDWSKMNPNFEEKLKDVEAVTDESLEKIIELQPDLIIGLSTLKNVDKLKQIAPTITYTYGKVDYLTQQLEIGKLLNKEKEATAWVDDFKARAQKAGEEIKAKIGADSTISVIETFDKQLYVFGDNWGRGTEILYQEMQLKMPEKVKEMALKDGYYALSAEVLPQYAGDYVIFSKNPDADNAFQNTDTYKNIPAVKNGHIYEVNAKAFYFNDPITLEYQLEFFIKSLLG